MTIAQAQARKASTTRKSSPKMSRRGRPAKASPRNVEPILPNSIAEMPPQSTPPKDAPENLLAHYFRDVAGLPVLRSEQEFEIAKNIESLEVKLWSQILSNPVLVESLLGYLEQKLEKKYSEFS